MLYSAIMWSYCSCSNCSNCCSVTGSHCICITVVTAVLLQVDKLQSEIEMVSSVRDEHEKSLKTCTTVPERNLINTRIDKANEKIQVCMCMYIYVCTCMCISMYGHVCISTYEQNSTELSKYIWQLKDSGSDFSITWKVLKRTISYSNSTNNCSLCNWEKYFIVTKPTLATWNKRNELVSACRHRVKYSLKKFITWLF